jgi:hypothetical protein
MHHLHHCHHRCCRGCCSEPSLHRPPSMLLPLTQELLLPTQELLLQALLLYSTPMLLRLLAPPSLSQLLAPLLLLRLLAQLLLLQPTPMLLSQLLAQPSLSQLLLHSPPSWFLSNCLLGDRRRQRCGALQRAPPSSADRARLQILYSCRTFAPDQNRCCTWQRVVDDGRWCGEFCLIWGTRLVCVRVRACPPCS